MKIPLYSKTNLIEIIKFNQHRIKIIKTKIKTEMINFKFL